MNLLKKFLKTINVLKNLQKYILLLYKLIPYL